MSLVWRIFALFFALGVILIFVAAAISLYPQSVISQLQSNLDSGQLSQQDTWDQEGSLRWWKLALWQTYQPISSVINNAGLLTIILSVLYGVFALAFGATRRKVSDEKEPLRPVVEKETQSVVPTPMVQAVVETKPAVKPEGKAKEYTAKARWYSYYVQKSGSSTPSQVEDYYKEEPREERSRFDYHPKPTGWWYLVPFLFGVIGGLIGYACVKGEDSDMASRLLIFGILWSFVLYFVGWGLISSILF